MAKIRFGEANLLGSREIPEKEVMTASKEGRGKLALTTRRKIF
jgi:hypothetical protein